MRFLNEASSQEPGSVLIPEGGSLRQESCAAEGCPGGWSMQTGFPTGTSGPPVVLHNDDVAVVSTQGDLAVIDGTTRAVEWRADLDSSVGNRPFAADPESIFATTADSRLVVFPVDGCGAATCTPSWTATLSSPASARPSIGGEVLYVGSEDGTVSAFDAGGCGALTCSPLWTGSTPAKVTGAPAIAGGRVIVGSSDGTITAFALPAAES